MGGIVGMWWVGVEEGLVRTIMDLAKDFFTRMRTRGIKFRIRIMVDEDELNVSLLSCPISGSLSGIRTEVGEG